jgi:hypothetical protein
MGKSLGKSLEKSLEITYHTYPINICACGIGANPP